MQNNPRKIIGTSIGIIFFILIIIFGFNRFGRFINGPEIISISIEPYTETTEHILFIEGVVKNTAGIRINNNEIPINDNFGFKDIITISSGYSLVEIYVYDTFGNERKYEYKIFNTNSDTLYESTYNEAITDIDEESLETITN